MKIALSTSLLVWIRAFDAAARHGSFTRAATELHVSQGAVSQQVKSLEQWLGVPLFHRAHRKLALSPDGQRLSLAVRESLDILQTALGRMRVDARHASIRLSCSPSFAARWLTPRLGNVLREHPQLSLRVYGEFHRLDRARMQADGMHAAVRFDTGDYTDLRAIAFLDEWLVPVAAPAFLAEHPQLCQPGCPPAAMMLHDASPWQNAEEHEEWNTWLRGLSLPVPAEHDGQRFNMSQLAVSAALAGQGVAMGRLSLVLEDLAAGRLVPLLKRAVRSRASYFFIAGDDGDERIALLQAWLQQEGRRFRRERNAWCRKAGLKLVDGPHPAGAPGTPGS